MKQNETKKNAENATIFHCEKCNFKCCKKSDWNRHVLTLKHANETKMKQKTPKNAEILCNHCEKKFNSRTSLWRHKKLCIINKMEKPDINNELIIDLIKQNQEFKELIIDQNSKIIELSKDKSIINNTTNNNNFNLNVFLNEKCKDALNIMDFINSLKLQLEDLENTGKLGYVQGITKIFIRGLKELDMYKRPIHCSDLKREILYVKDNTWEKDNEKKQMKKAIKHIASKNFKQISEWVEENPESKDIESKKHEEYMKIINKSTGGMTLEEDDDNFNKIIKNVAKEVIIEK
jgi:hypothetical protein